MKTVKVTFNSIHEALQSFGVFRHYCGYDYFVCAVKMAAEEQKRLKNMRKEIYEPVAEMYGTSIFNVERDIRTIRDVMMKNNGKELLNVMTGNCFWYDRVPYPKEIIGLFADYFKNSIIL